MYDGFIYETTCIINGMKYRGRHERSHSNPKDPDDSWYIGSPTNPQFWEDLKKYGRDSFVREILDKGPFQEKIEGMKQETRRLKEVDAAHNPLYYNKSNWGGTLDQSGENNPMYGKTWKQSKDAIAKLSASMTGHVVTLETKSKISSTLLDYFKINPHNRLGCTNSEETRLKISLGLKRYYEEHEVSEETRKKQSDSHRAENLSTETREKLSMSKLGNKCRLGCKSSEETKKRLSESHRGIKMPPRKYHLICKNCDQEFLGNSPSQKYCDECNGGVRIV